MSGQDRFATIATAPIFVIQSDIQIPGKGSLGTLKFQELAGINSEISIEQYVSVAADGVVEHTKQFGLTKPPSVTLKRGLDKNLKLWAWHEMALKGDPKARADQVHLSIYAGGAAGLDDARLMMEYTLVNAWCAKINISGAKAGEGVVTEDVVIACDMILQGDGTHGR